MNIASEFIYPIVSIDTFPVSKLFLDIHALDVFDASVIADQLDLILQDKVDITDAPDISQVIPCFVSSAYVHVYGFFRLLIDRYGFVPTSAGYSACGYAIRITLENDENAYEMYGLVDKLSHFLIGKSVQLLHVKEDVLTHTVSLDGVSTQKSLSVLRHDGVDYKIARISKPLKPL